MGRLDETAFIERQQFFDGQRLFALDLQGLEAFNREMRWLHNQSLHQPGIGNGFAVAGQKGDSEVTIGPGYAIDAKGREIVLTGTHAEPVPPVKGDGDGNPVYYDLTVSYPSDEYLEVAETRAGVCQSRGAVRLREEPVFCWVRLRKTETGNWVACDSQLGKDIETGHKIVLARAEVQNCQLKSDLSVVQRRSARPAKQPYIACGEVEPEWELTWFVDRDAIKELIAELLIRREELDLGSMLGVIFAAASSSTASEALSAAAASGINCEQLALLGPYILPFGIKAKIDTSRYCFLTTPCYCARIEGSRLNKIDLTSL